MGMESTYGNEHKNMRRHYTAIKNRYGPFKKLGQDRFQYLLAALEPSIDELKQIADALHQNFVDHIDEMTVGQDYTNAYKLIRIIF